MQFGVLFLYSECLILFHPLLTTEAGLKQSQESLHSLLLGIVSGMLVPLSHSTIRFGIMIIAPKCLYVRALKGKLPTKSFLKEHNILPTDVCVL